MTNYLKRIKNLVYRFKDLTILGIANLVSSAISVVFWLYIATLLETEEYGEISYLIAIAGVAAVISLVGAGNTLTIYTAKEIRIQATIFFVAIVSSTIAAIVIYILFFNLINNI